MEKIFKVGDTVAYIFADNLYEDRFEIVADKDNPIITENGTTIATADFVIVKVPIVDFSPFDSGLYL
jgi:hypothetical protein